ncbi:T9SS type A sorting domain-containing protein [Marinilabilia sp.]
MGDSHLDKVIDEMQGIATYYYTDSTHLQFSGEVYNDSVTINPNDPGYHLVGNPFPTAIDWEDPAGWTRKGFSNTMWYWVNAGSERVIQTYNNNGDDLPGVGTIIDGYDESTISHIPPYQSVWMKQDTTANVPLTVKRAARVKNSDAPLKSASKGDSKSKSYDLLRVQAQNAHTMDGTVIYFHEKFKETKGREDSEKRFNGSKNVPELYTHVDGKAVAINGLPALNGNSYSIPLSVRNRIEEPVTLHFNAEEFGEDYVLYLEDKDKGSWTNLKVLSRYTYEPAKTGDDKDRFVIHVEKVMQTPTNVDEMLESSNTNGIEIAGYENYARVSISDDLMQSGQATIELLDVNGRLILSQTTMNPETEIILPEQSGVYVVRVKVEGAVKSEKVVKR